MIGGALYGQLDISLFYPALLATVPLTGVVYAAMGAALEKTQAGNKTEYRMQNKIELKMY